MIPIIAQPTKLKPELLTAKPIIKLSVKDITVVPIQIPSLTSNAIPASAGMHTRSRHKIKPEPLTKKYDPQWLRSGDIHAYNAQKAE